MKVLQINTVYPQGSTGKICKGISELCEENQIENYVAYAQTNNVIPSNGIRIGTWLDNHIHNRLARITMLTGCFSVFHTITFLKKVKQIGPDIIHLHNLHGNYINIGLLFLFIKKRNINVVWTLHDCWTYTGYCTHYGIVNCEKWKDKCKNCPNKNIDSITVLDNSKIMYQYKKKLFYGLKKLVLVTPSQWLSNEVGKSFLSHHRRVIIPNGIDLNVFKPTANDFREVYQINLGQKIVLGVSYIWHYSKGLDVFIELSKMLDQSYKIVLVGTDDEIDKVLPSNIISIHRTSDQIELAKIYSAADIFANPTREEMFGLVNIEALACGTPVVTFNVGGSPECIDDTCGSVVEINDIIKMKNEIERICMLKPYSKEACIKRASMFNMCDKFSEYIELYRGVYERSAKKGT